MSDEIEVAETETQAPSEPLVAEMPTAEEAAEARNYSNATLRATIADMALDAAVLSVMAVAVGPRIDSWLASFAPLAGEQSYARLAVLAAVLTILHACISLPLSFYAGYTLEHRFGLSTQTPAKWLTTWLKKMGLTLLLLTPLYTGLFAIIWLTGNWWWLLAAVAMFVLGAVLGQLMPVLILPLFYKVDRLDDAETLERMEGMAGDAGLTVEGVYRLGLSEETTKANAMLAGLGKTRRVLMGDTLLSGFSPEEIDIVFAHELGHHVHKHLPKLLITSAAVAVGGFYLVHRGMIAWTGGTDASAWSTAALPAIMLLLWLYSLLVGPLQNIVSRHFERQADAYALSATGNPGAFRSAFLKLARMNKADLEPNPVEVFLLHSHPPIGERLAAAEATR